MRTDNNKCTCVRPQLYSSWMIADRRGSASASEEAAENTCFVLGHLGEHELTRASVATRPHPQKKFENYVIR